MTTANPLETYRADISIDGASVSVVASSMTILADLIARLKGAAPQAHPVSQAPKAPKAEKQASAPAAQEAPGKSESAPPAAAPAAADKPADASTQAAAVSYDDVKKIVNALYVIKPQHAIDLLKQFDVTKGPELQPQQWPDVVAAGQTLLAKVGG